MRILAIMNADRKNDAELRMNVTLRPNAAATRPPIDAPSASITDQVPVDSALAVTRSSRATTAGIVADLAGSKNPVADTATISTAYAIHTVPGVRTSRRPRITTPRTRSAVIMMLRRSKRSITMPTIGVTNEAGRSCSTRTSATDVADPVSWKSSE